MNPSHSTPTEAREACRYYRFTSHGRSKRQWTVGFDLGSKDKNDTAVLRYAWTHNARFRALQTANA